MTGKDVFMIQTTVKVSGMACSMCESHVCDTIRNQFKVKKVSASHAKGEAVIVSETELSEAELKAELDPTGYTPTNCAERTAFFKAVSEGVREFEAICVVGGKDGILTDYASPCGVCRQVMMEFCDPETFQIILATGKEQYEVFTLKEILPLGFGPKNLR